MDYTDRLRRLALNDTDLPETPGVDGSEPHLDDKTLALIRLAALVAVGGASPSFAAEADAAVSAGASASEIVDVLMGVFPIVGLPCVVAAAPHLALALGYDIDSSL